MIDFRPWFLTGSNIYKSYLKNLTIICKSCKIVFSTENSYLDVIMIFCFASDKTTFVINSAFDYTETIDCFNKRRRKITWNEHQNDFPKCGHEWNDISLTSIMRVNNDKRYFRRYLRLRYSYSALETSLKS